MLLAKAAGCMTEATAGDKSRNLKAELKFAVSVCIT